MRKICIWLSALFLMISILFINPVMKKPSSGLRSAQLEKTVTNEGNVERTAYLDEKGVLTTPADLGYAVRTVTKTDAGSLEEFLDEKGKKVSRSAGYYGIFREYDEAGNNIRNTYLDDTGSPVMISGGYASEERTYNEDRQVVAVKYLDEDGKPVMTSLYGAERLNEYEEDGSGCTITYLDLSGSPVMTDQGYAIMVQTYYHTDGPENGKVENEFYFDENNEPAEQSLGQYGLHREYNEIGQTAVLTYLDAEGNPTITTKGYTTVVRTFQPNNAVATELYYDRNGDPFQLPEGQYGIQREDGQTNYLDAEGNRQFNIKNLLYNQSWFVILFAATAVVLSAVISRKGNIVLLVLYLGVIGYLTLMFREAGDSRTRLELFWSYKKFFTDSETRADIIKNIWLFIPLGAILYRLRPKMSTLFAAFSFSALIEVIQYFSGTGLCELDDVINNSLGGLLGYGAARFLEEMAGKWRGRKQE